MQTNQVADPSKANRGLGLRVEIGASIGRADVACLHGDTWWRRSIPKRGTRAVR